jgi:hypothetical protein
MKKEIGFSSEVVRYAGTYLAVNGEFRRVPSQEECSKIREAQEEEIRIEKEKILKEKTEQAALRKFRKENKKKLAIERILNNSLFMAMFPSTRAGVKSALNWKDEEGKGFKNDDMIIRTMNATGHMLFYNGELSKQAKMAVNELKMDFAKQEDGHEYFDARPITFENWKGLTLKRKMASYIPKDLV